MRTLNYSWKPLDANTWITSPHDLDSNFPITMRLCHHQDSIICTLSAELIIDRQWIQRELALRLLESNSYLSAGRYFLRDRSDGVREIEYGTGFNSHRMKVSDAALRCLRLVADFEKSLCELYARDLLVESDVRFLPPRVSDKKRENRKE
jgi:hypothetical protein